MGRRKGVREVNTGLADREFCPLMTTVQSVSYIMRNCGKTHASMKVTRFGHRNNIERSSRYNCDFTAPYLNRQCSWSQGHPDQLSHQGPEDMKREGITRKHTFLAWQRSRTDEHRGRWTARLIPDVVPWTQGGRLNYVTQLLSGHGYFRPHLSRI